MTPEAFHALVLVWCAKFRASVTSGYRTPARNAKVGGHPRSRHLLALAADVAYDDPAPPRDEREATARQLGLSLVVESDHDHLQG